MSIGTDNILLHEAGILHTVPKAKRIEGLKATLGGRGHARQVGVEISTGMPLGTTSAVE